MKLELKHLSPYLPYGLKIYEPVQELNLRLDLSTSYNTKNIGLPFLFLYGGYRIEYGLPILRPLSDLYKLIDTRDKIEHYPYSTLKIPLDLAMNMDYKNINNFPHKVISQMIEWHFDVFGLIDKGLAININEL